MRRFTHCGLLACCLLLPFPERLLARDPGPRMVTEAEAPVWRAVGRLNVAGNRHCSATLIADDLVLTAAHCLFNARTGRRAQPGNMRFVAGQRRQTYAALRGVTAAVILPGFAFRDRADARGAENDLALLRLDAPILPTEAVPLPVGSWDRSGTVSMVAFGRDRAFIASVREDCRALGQSPALVVLDCPVVPGVSGAPVLLATDRGPVVVGVVSAAMSADAYALAVLLTPALVDALVRALPDAPIMPGSGAGD